MQISIVVPVYRESATLEPYLTLLARIVDQDPDVDVVVVDGGSDDGTRQLLGKLERTGQIQIQIHSTASAVGPSTSRMSWFGAERGRAKQMNAGARASYGEILLFLHADTALQADGLQQLRKAISAGAVGGYFRLRLDSDRLLLRLAGRLISLRSHLTGVASGDQGIFVTRRAFEQLGGYAEQRLFEDLDLSRRLKGAGEVAALHAYVVTSARRWESAGVIRTIVRMWLLRILYYGGMHPDRLARYYETAR